MVAKLTNRNVEFVCKECGKFEMKLEDKRIKINSDCLLAVSLTQSLRLISNNKSTTRDSNFTFDNFIKSDINVDGDGSM